MPALGPGGAHAEFVRANASLASPGLVPEVRLRLSGEPWRLWEAAERAFGAATAPPFWAFAWAGGQALARYVLDHPHVVRGRRVLDVATGSGIVAIAAAKAGASAVLATDIDPLAVAAVALNAAANDVTVAARRGDVLDAAGLAAWPPGEAGTVLAADVFYERELSGRVMRFLAAAPARGAAVLVADIGRRYLPRQRFRELASYDVPVLPSLEDAEVKRASVLEPTG